jgi:nucleoside-diphosphate-sugar epimerase
MRILVTGNRGFVGTETCRLLKEHGHEVVGYDLMDGMDIRDKELLDRTCANLTETIGEKQGEFSFAGNGVDRILHLAAIARFDEADKNPILTHETNVLGTINVVEVAKKYHIPLVFASTGSAYMPIKLDPPITEEFPIMGNSVYGCSKALADLYVQTHTPHIVLRYAHLYGAEKRYHGLIGGFASRIEHDLEPTLYGGKQSNDFCYIKDVAQANLLALEASWDKWNQVYNIGTGQELTAEDAGRAVCDVLDYKGKVKIEPQRSVDAQRFVFDISKARRMLGYEPQFTFKEGLADMFKEGS